MRSRPSARIRRGHPNGARTPATVTSQEALSFAQSAAKEFGVGPGRNVDFDKDRAKKDVAGEGDTKTKAKKATKKAAAAKAPEGEE